MAGTVILCNLAVICGDLGGIADHQGDGSTGGLSVKDTGQNLHLIGFFTLCSDSTGAGFTAIQIFLNLFFGERKSGGQPSTTTPSAFPWDSPQVVILKMLPNVEPAMTVLLFHRSEPHPCIRKSAR